MEARKPGSVGRRRYTPESEFYDGLKGRIVDIQLMRRNHPITGRLVWVDRYSLGLQVVQVGAITGQVKHGPITLVSKGAIERIWEAK